MVYKTPFYSTKGVVASEHPLASMIGIEILKQGGNAVDAAVATSFALAVTQPHLGGLGGDFFALVMDPDGRVYFIDGSGYAPKNLTRDLLINKGYREMPQHGVYSINIPGMVDALRLLWVKYGSMEWQRLVQPSIDLSLKGYPMYHGLSNAIEKNRALLEKDQGSRETYLSMNYAEKSIIKFPGLVEALKLIMHDPRSFYEGEIAEAIVEYVNKLGGVLDLEDFKRYRASSEEPLKINYRDTIVYEMPPPTQGATTLHMLMMLNQVDLKSVPSDSSERINILLEKAYYAYCIRDQYISDPRYMEISSSDLVSRDFLAKALEMCRDHHGVGGDGDTTFFAVADHEGWVVSAIQSLFHGFGSFITEPKYGITLNSRASSFKLDDRSVNRLEPGKKTMHTLSSMIVVEENRVLALGLSGGHYRPLLHSQVLTNIIDYGMDVQDALEYPRFIWLIDSNVVEYEEGLKPNNPRYEFIVKPYPSRTGVAAAVEHMGRVIAGYCDIRGDGLPIGLL